VGCMLYACNACRLPLVITRLALFSSRAEPPPFRRRTERRCDVFRLPIHLLRHRGADACAAAAEQHLVLPPGADAFLQQHV